MEKRSKVTPNAAEVGWRNLLGLVAADAPLGRGGWTREMLHTPAGEGQTASRGAAVVDCGRLFILIEALFQCCLSCREERGV